MGSRKVITLCVGPLFIFVRQRADVYIVNNVKFSDKKAAMMCIATFNLASRMGYRRSLR